ncbi:MAG: hypothetical protein WEA58_08860 [Balneolaceae bacterium]
MKKQILNILSAIIILSIIIAAFMAYFMVTVNTNTGVTYDGLGRTLTEPPFWASFVVYEDRWPGFLWWILDKVWFFGGFYLAFLLYSWSEND